MQKKGSGTRAEKFTEKGFSSPGLFRDSVGRRSPSVFIFHLLFLVCWAALSETKVSADTAKRDAQQRFESVFSGEGGETSWVVRLNGTSRSRGLDRVWSHTRASVRHCVVIRSVQVGTAVYRRHQEYVGPTGRQVHSQVPSSRRLCTEAGARVHVLGDLRALAAHGI